MAKKETKKTAPADTGVVKPPAGFDIVGGRRDSEGWVVIEKGAVVTARVLSRHTMKQRRGDDKPKSYYQLVLIEPARCKVGTGEDAEIEMLGAGATVNLDEKATFLSIGEKLELGGVWDVWFHVTGKKDVGRPQPMWVADVRFRMVKPPAKKQEQVADQGGDDDIPF